MPISHRIMVLGTLCTMVVGCSASEHPPGGDGGSQNTACTSDEQCSNGFLYYCANGECHERGQTGNRCRYISSTLPRCDDPLAVCEWELDDLYCQLPTCGRPGLPCCEFNDPCVAYEVEVTPYAPSVCVDNVCEACGHTGEPCCVDTNDYPNFCWTRDFGTGWISCVADTCLTDPSVDDACSPGVEIGPDPAELLHRPGSCMDTSWLDDIVTSGSGWTYAQVLNEDRVWQCCLSDVCGPTQDLSSLSRAGDWDVAYYLSGDHPFSTHAFVAESDRTLVHWRPAGDWYVITVSSDGYILTGDVYKDGASDTTPNETWVCQ